MNDSFKELKRIRKTSCKNLIEKSIRQTLSSREQATLLSIAVILLNSEEEVLQDYGYRIVLQYSNRTKDYLPLFEVALNYGYIPIAHVFEKELYKNRETVLMPSAFIRMESITLSSKQKCKKHSLSVV